MTRNPPPIFLDLRSAAQALSLSEATIERLTREGNFPQKRKVSDRRAAWLFRDLIEWAESRPVSELPPPPNTGAPKRKRA